MRIFSLGLAALLIVVPCFAAGESAPVRNIQIYPKSAETHLRGHVSVLPPSQVPAKGDGHEAPEASLEPDQAAVRELEKVQNDRAKANVALNTVNPLSDDFSKPVAGDLSPEAARQVERLKVLTANPVVKNIISITTDPGVNSAMKKVSSSRDLRHLLAYEIGLLVLFFFIRTWRLAFAKNFLQRIWVGMYCGAGYVATASFAVPLWVIGSPYRELLDGVWRVVRVRAGI